ncbi:MAG: ADP-ribosyltransferase [Streptococcus sp.]|nr:ADP-ribosyltransferase [Streptococcus sp.]
MTLEVFNIPCYRAFTNNDSEFSDVVLSNFGKLFYREYSNRRSEMKHFGIGLSFVKQVTSRHSGELVLEYSGHGAMVKLLIPMGIVVSSGETIGERLRSEQWVSGTIHSIYNTLKKYSTKKDIVVYRGVSKPVFDKMIESAKGDVTIDFKAKAFLHTSVVKGCENSDSYRKLRIKVPKGTNAFYAGNINSEESIYYEVVVQKGARLKVILIDDYINCELVGTD